MAKFVRSDFGGTGPVVVELWRTLDDQVLANIWRMSDGPPYPATSWEMPAHVAVRLAEADANALGCDVRVIDPGGHWRNEWGELEPEWDYSSLGDHTRRETEEGAA